MAYDLLQSHRVARRRLAQLHGSVHRGPGGGPRSALRLSSSNRSPWLPHWFPEIGYDKAAALAKEAYAAGKTIREAVREKAGIPEARLDELLDPAKQAG